MATDRKELIRQYRESARPMGVGAVRNRVNGKVYLFAGRDLRALLNRNQAQLRLNAHPSKALQADWDSLGREAFEFEALDTLAASEDAAHDPTDDLRALEAMWLEKLAPYEPAGYNRRPGAAR